MAADSAGNMHTAIDAIHVVTIAGIVSSLHMMAAVIHAAHIAAEIVSVD